MTLDAELWGPEPSDAEVCAAIEAGRAAAEQARRDLPVGWDRSADGNGLPHLDEARRAYPGSDLSFAVWMTTANADLNGATPGEALRAGRRAGVIEAATALRLDAA